MSLRRALQIMRALVFMTAASTVYPARADDGQPPQLSFDARAANAVVIRDPSTRLIDGLLKQDAADLLDNLGVDSEWSRDVGSALSRKTLVFHSTYRTIGGEPRRVFLYDCAVHSWPGTQPVTIVLTDGDYRLIAWREVGGSPALVETKLVKSVPGRPVLVLTFRFRHTSTHPERGVYRLSLAGDQIPELPAAEWIYSSDEQLAFYENLRQLENARRAAARGGVDPR